MATYLVPGTHESISPGNTATGITGAKREPTTGEFTRQNAMAALITVEDNSARFCMDGTTPTNSNGTSADTGHKIDAGQSKMLESPAEVTNFLILDAVSGSVSVIKVTPYFGR